MGSGGSRVSVSTPGSTREEQPPPADSRILRPDGKPLRVTFCPVNTAGVPWTTAQALRGRGVDARLVVFNRYALHPEADGSLDLEGGLIRRQGRQWRELRHLLPQTDIFHFVFGLTLVPQSLQFPILRAYGKRSVFHYLGSDIRGKTPEQLKFGKKADGEIVGSYDAIRWVPEATVIPPGIDVRSIVPSPPVRHDRPVVVHAPSSRERKGTARVVEACAGLDVDLQIVEGLHHAEAFERYRNADIIVDQLHAGWYGLFAIECMALGKPVVTFLHDEAVRRTEEAYEIPVPIVNASPEDLHHRIAELVALGPEGRAELGARSRAYVERVHDLERVTDRLLDLYAAVLEREPARRKQAVRAVAARAPLAPPEPDPFGLDQPDLETGMPTAVAPRQTADELGGGIGGQLRRLSKHSAIYGIGGLVSRIIAVILLPLYTHYLTPGDYGNIETLLALTTIMGLLLRAGITSAFFRFYFDAEDEAGRLQVLRTSFWFTMGAATLGLALLVGFAAPSPTSFSTTPAGRTSSLRQASRSGRRSTTSSSPPSSGWRSARPHS